MGSLRHREVLCLGKKTISVFPTGVNWNIGNIGGWEVGVGVEQPEIGVDRLR
jgi:hypothetical protein